MQSMRWYPARIKVSASKSGEESIMVILVIEMKRMIKEMMEEVESVDRGSTSVCEELYGKLEGKVKKKFTEEVERLEKSFRRIIEQLEI